MGKVTFTKMSNLWIKVDMWLFVIENWFFLYLLVLTYILNIDKFLFIDLYVKFICIIYIKLHSKLLI
jgi:hypothetical protein